MRISKQWEVAAPAAAVFAAVSDPRTYPLWWSHVVPSVEGDAGPIAVGWRCVAQVMLQGRRDPQTYQVTRLEAPREVEFTVSRGPLTSRSVWIVEPQASGPVRVRRDFYLGTGGLLSRMIAPLMYPGALIVNRAVMREAARGLEAYANGGR